MFITKENDDEHRQSPKPPSFGVIFDGPMDDSSMGLTSWWTSHLGLINPYQHCTWPKVKAMWLLDQEKGKNGKRKRKEIYMWIEAN